MRPGGAHGIVLECPLSWESPFLVHLKIARRLTELAPPPGLSLVKHVAPTHLCFFGAAWPLPWWQGYQPLRISLCSGDFPKLLTSRRPRHRSLTGRAESCAANQYLEVSGGCAGVWRPSSLRDGQTSSPLSHLPSVQQSPLHPLHPLPPSAASSGLAAVPSLRTRELAAVGTVTFRSTNSSSCGIWTSACPPGWTFCPLFL